jgi:hypothetical protein
MTDIRYVCLSDLHLGEEDSLLTNLKTASSTPDPSQPSPVMKQLVECIKYLILKNEGEGKPTLILNGDVLELALTTTDQAAMAFERFIELIMPPGDELFGNIIYVPANHDHHLWELARETQYVNYLTKFKPGDELPIPWHATKVFMENDPTIVPSYFLTNLVKRYPHLEDFVIHVTYPNFGLITDDDRKCVIFHHGHFIEPLYYLMSTLKTILLPDREMPESVYGIEEENYAWIDFFWSTMGRSGDVGVGIETIYERMHDPKHFKELLDNFADKLAERYDLPGWGDWMEAKILKGVLNYLADEMYKRERTHAPRPLSEEAEEGLWSYMIGPLQHQILTEHELSKIPYDVSFVFGHTHKPFQEDMNFRGYPEWVNVYNTGGWVVDHVDRKSIYGGAVVLADENLNLTSLRMYNEAERPEEYSVRVEQATHAGEETNPFHHRIAGLVKAAEDPWSTFSAKVARAVYIRAQNLRSRMRERA